MKKIILTIAIALTSTVAFSAENYSCGGTEPFWGAKIVGDKFVMASPEMEKPTISDIVSRRSAAGVGPDYVFVVKTKKETATIVTGECSDGMSDTVYSHHIVIDNNSPEVLYGCCNVQRK